MNNRIRNAMIPDLVIGIDPDISKNGVALVNTHTKRLELISTMEFPALLEYLHYTKEKAESSDLTLTVVVEAGWLNTSNWHVHPLMSAQKCAAMGASVGANQETGRKIVEMLKYWHVRCVEQKPLALTIKIGRKSINKWSGKDGKISHEDLEAFATGAEKRNNQEARDAALLAWTYAGLPVKYALERLRKPKI